MKILPIIGTLLLLICKTTKGQTITKKDIFFSDSIPIYVGVVNKFQIRKDEIIEQVGSTKGLNVQINESEIEIRPYWQGFFQLRLLTQTGIKRVLLVSKILALKERNQKLIPQLDIENLPFP